MSTREQEAPPIVHELEQSDLRLRLTAARLRGDDAAIEQIEGYLEQQHEALLDGIILRFFADEAGEVSWVAQKKPTLVFKDLPRKP